MSQLSRKTQLTINMVRRYWYNSTNGLQDGPALSDVRLTALEAIARVLGVTPGALIVSSEESAAEKPSGNTAPTPHTQVNACAA